MLLPQGVAMREQVWADLEVLRVMNPKMPELLVPLNLLVPCTWLERENLVRQQIPEAGTRLPRCANLDQGTAADVVDDRSIGWRLSGFGVRVALPSDTHGVRHSPLVKLLALGSDLPQCCGDVHESRIFAVDQAHEALDAGPLPLASVVDLGRL